MVYIEERNRIRPKRRLTLAGVVIAWSIVLFLGIGILIALPLDSNGLRIGGIVVLAVDAVIGLIVWRMSKHSTAEEE